jgi:hypothetical protein
LDGRKSEEAKKEISLMTKLNNESLSLSIFFATTGELVSFGKKEKLLAMVLADDFAF